MPTTSILRAVARAMRRDFGTFFALKVNNFFLFVLLIAYGNVIWGMAPRSAYPFLLVFGLLLLFPMSSDPLTKIPPIRLALWPLTAKQRTLMRLATLALSPVLWFALFLLFLTAPSLGLAFVALTAAMQIAHAVLRPSAKGVAFTARFQLPGRVGPLIAGAWRQMFSILDTWLALLFALGGWCYRFLSPAPDPAAYPIFSLLIALALSTYTQCLFGLESESAMTRYQLLPLRQYEVLLAKDAAFLGLLVVLTLPLNSVCSLTFGFTSLAIGHFPSLRFRSIQYRGRFTGGRIGFCAAQIIVGLAFGFAVAHNIVYALGPITGYILSTNYAVTPRR
jgi:hypothetical protein